MGTQKLLLPLGNEPLVRRSVRQICDAGFDEVLVVLGHEHVKVLAVLEGLAIRHALNAAYETGMGSSFRTAVEHLTNSAAAMFALADQPFVTTHEYRTLLDTYRGHAPAIVSVRYGEVVRRRIYSNGSSFPSWPNSSTALVPSCSDTATGPWSCSSRRTFWWISIRLKTTSGPRAACLRDGEGCRRSR
jgi:hypothetical protein